MPLTTRELAARLVKGVASLAALVYLWALFATPTKQRAILPTKAHITSLVKLALLFLLGRRRKGRLSLLPPDRPPALSASLPMPLLQCTVEQYSITESQVSEFTKLLTGGPLTAQHGTSAPPSAVADAMLFVFPHALAQSLALMVLTHADFPVDLMGSVHLRSAFTIHDRRRLAELFDFGAQQGSSPAGAASSSKIVRISVTYAGTAKSANGKGVDVYLLLELHREERVLWSEIMVIFKPTSSKDPTRGVHASQLLGAASAETMSADFAHVDFTSLLPAAPSAQSVRATASGNDTWTFGVTSGDINPIHMFSLGAKLFGFPGRIAHGMLVVGKVLAAGAWTAESVDQLFVSFKAPVPCDSEVATTTSPLGFDVLVVDKRSQEVKQPGRPNICVRVTSGARLAISEVSAAPQTSHL